VCQKGDVYFDSVAMFIFFLLLGRFLEQRVRYKNFLQTGQWQQLIPLTAFKKTMATATEPESKAVVPVKSLVPGDWVWVASGETFPCDGEVMEGQSSADESLLTGEANPHIKQVGHAVVAGSQNIESGLWIKVTAIGQQTCLADIDRLVQSAASSRPKHVAFADKLAGAFVARVLILTVLVAAFWSFYDPSRALWVTLSVLVVTCPCALTLATPAALTSALSALRRNGILVTSGMALERLETITDVVFDKTGTLTKGHLSLEVVNTLGPSSEDLKTIAAALQRVSSHPIARAFAPFNQSSITVKEAKSVTSQGVEGIIHGQLYRMGRPSFCVEGAATAYPAEGLWLALAQGSKLIGWFGLRDKVRDEAMTVLEVMGLMNCQRHLLSGDRQSNVDKLCQELRFDVALGEQTPADKLCYVQKLQAQGRKVLMVGDGINDVPVLAAADTSIAMGQASELAKLQADIILLTNDLMQIPKAITLSAQVVKVIKQNLTWALVYNVLALPLAIAGFVPPWLAAIGMSLSSLVVVLNALRLAR
jgi:Cu2+-exporting ATPase